METKNAMLVAKTAITKDSGKLTDSAVNPKINPNKPEIVAIVVGMTKLAMRI
jgi:hypothetical protein